MPALPYSGAADSRLVSFMWQFRLVFGFQKHRTLVTFWCIAFEKALEHALMYAAMITHTFHTTLKPRWTKTDFPITTM